MLNSLFSLLIGYLGGSILAAYFIARLSGFDIRQKGSGNPGIANAAKVMGVKTAILIAFYDLFKAPLTMVICAQLFRSQLIAYLAGLGALLGHLFPFYLKFKGGKGLSVCTGILGYALIKLILLDNRFLLFVLPLLFLTALHFFLQLKFKKLKLSQCL